MIEYYLYRMKTLLVIFNTNTSKAAKAASNMINPSTDFQFFQDIIAPIFQKLGS